MCFLIAPTALVNVAPIELSGSLDPENIVYCARMTKAVLLCY